MPPRSFRDPRHILPLRRICGALRHAGIFICGLGLAAMPPAGHSAGNHVDLLLVLAIDCSYSVSEQEYDLQRQGIAAAMQAPEISEAVGAGPHGEIAIAVVQWSSEHSQIMAVPWTRIRTPGDAAAFAARMGRLPRLTRDGATSISAAIAYSSRIMDRSGLTADRKIIDVSGDGRNNNGRDPRPLVNAMAHRITVNGLAILNEDPTLDIYFRQQVIGGFGAFVMAAQNYADYRRAIRRKLLHEIRYIPISRKPDPAGFTRFARFAPS